MAQGNIGILLDDAVSRRRPGSLKAARRWAMANPIGVLGLVLIVTLLLMALTANFVSTHDPEDLNAPINLGVSSEHYLGTDTIGRDIFTNMMYGSRVSLSVGLIAVFVGVTAGALLGLTSGYLMGTFDLMVQRLIDAKLAIPQIILALTIMAILGNGLFNVILAISVGGVALATRVTRSVVLREKEKVYTEAARSIGASPMRVMFRHVMPNSLTPYLVLISVSIGNAIVAEATLSFLGAGVSPNTPSWGIMLSTAAASYFDAAPALALAPGLCITAAVLGFNLFGDAVRDTLDPRLRRA